MYERAAEQIEELASDYNLEQTEEAETAIHQDDPRVMETQDDGEW